MRSFKLSFIMAASLVLALCALAWAGPKEKELAVTYVKAPLNVPSIMEKKLGIFEKAFAPEGVTVVYPELMAGPQQTQAMAAGSVQIAHCLGGASALMAATEGVDLKIVGIYSRAPKAFVILVKDPAIKKVSDLKGRKVAGPKGTVLHQLLVAALKKEGLKASDATLVAMGLPEGVAALLSGGVDAALAAGPSVAKAQEQGARILTDGRGLVEATTVIAAAGSFLAEHPDRMKRFMEAHRSTLALMRDKPGEAQKLTAEETGLTPAEVKAMLPMYDFDPTIRASDLADLAKTQDFLLENGLMRKKVDLNVLVKKGF
jgi:sulfonate transport system substrate-binding protein